LNKTFIFFLVILFLVFSGSKSFPMSESSSAFPEGSTNAVQKQSGGDKNSPPEFGSGARQYTVKKHDRLWKIAGREDVYGNPEFWEYIYEANRDILGKSFRRGDFIVVIIEPGMILKIPPVRVRKYLEGIRP
jgi:nucleoid-associated protein YgaU